MPELTLSPSQESMNSATGSNFSSNESSCMSLLTFYHIYQLTGLAKEGKM